MYISYTHTLQQQDDDSTSLKLISLTKLTILFLTFVYQLFI